MKTRNKALLIALCAVLLVAATALTTIAWLTSTTDTVVNTFTFSDSDNINITLDELKVDEYGKKMAKVTDKDDKVSYIKPEDIDAHKELYPDDEIEYPCRVIANTYKLIPGHTYIKDPTIHVTNSIDCYLFVTVDNAIADIEDGNGTTIAAQMAAHGWVKVTGYTNVYAYYGDATALKKIERSETADQDIVVFESFTIKGEPTAKELEKYHEKTVVVKAYAVQAEGFEGKTAVDVWEAAFSGKGTKETSSTPVEEPSTDGADGE